ncbi:MAG: peptide deformylase [Bacteroidales bacterium]|nr:MAG: peptide deformylase [Bacteroidales bacterium]
MIYPIVVYGHPVLRRKSVEVQQGQEGLQEFIRDLWETMHISDGIGLAGPQVGKSLRIFVIDTAGLADEDPSLKNFKSAFINPAIVERTGEREPFNEGCLSIPNIREDVVRESRIRIQYYDEDFNFHDESYDGVLSRIIQHEYDHLEGILFTDLIPPIRKRLLKGKLNAISRGKFDANYKTVLPKMKLEPEILK